MKKLLLTALLFSSCFAVSSQEDLEIIGTVVNNQNRPVSSAYVSIPAAFLSAATSTDGKFNLSLANVDYKMDDIIEISSKAETLKITIGEYMELNNKYIVINDGSFANENNTKNIATNKKEPLKYTEAKKTSLVLNRVKKGNQIFIKNQRGKTFFKERVQTENLLKKEFDLNFLKDGSYFFEIEKDLQIDIIPFTVSFERGIIYLESKKATIHKPHIKFEDQIVRLSQLSLDRKPVTINIYDNNSELLHTETTNNEQNINRVYKLGKGEFKIVIKSMPEEVYSTI